MVILIETEPPLSPLPPLPNPSKKSDKTKVRTKKGRTTCAGVFYANFNVKQDPKATGKYKLEVLEKEELPKNTVLACLPDNKLYNWIVEIRLRGNGRHHDKFYIHSPTRQKFRSTPEVIDYILNGKNVENRRRRRANVQNEEESGSNKKTRNEEQGEDSNSNSLPGEGVINNGKETKNHEIVDPDFVEKCRKLFFRNNLYNLEDSECRKKNLLRHRNNSLAMLGQENNGTEPQGVGRQEGNALFGKMNTRSNNNGNSLFGRSSGICSIGNTGRIAMQSKLLLSKSLSSQPNGNFSIGSRGNGSGSKFMRNNRLFGQSNVSLSTRNTREVSGAESIRSNTSFGQPRGFLQSRPYIPYYSQNCTNVQGDWSTRVNRKGLFGSSMGGTLNNLLNKSRIRNNVAYPGTGLQNTSLFGSSIPSLQSYPSLVNIHNSTTILIPPPSGYNTYYGSGTSIPDKSLRANFMHNKNGTKESSNPIIVIDDDDSDNSAELDKDDDKGVPHKDVLTEEEMIDLMTDKCDISEGAVNGEMPSGSGTKDLKNTIYDRLEELLNEDLPNENGMEDLTNNTCDFIEEFANEVLGIKERKDMTNITNAHSQVLFGERTICLEELNEMDLIREDPPSIQPPESRGEGNLVQKIDCEFAETEEDVIACKALVDSFYDNVGSEDGVLE